MNILDILNERLPEGLTIVSAKEAASKFKITFEYDGTRATAELTKTCAPGFHNRHVDSAIITAMSSILYDRGDYDGAMRWMGKLQEERGGCDFCDNFDFRRVGYDFDYGPDMPGVYFPGGFMGPPADQRFKYCPVCGRSLTEEHFKPLTDRRRGK